MFAPIVQLSEIVTLLGAASVSDVVFDESIALAPYLVAADGGATGALARGHVPEAVIGDLDSLPPDVLAQIPQDRLHRIAEQDTTDFDKALRHIEVPLILAVGFTGQRLDHELAVYNALVRNPARAVIVIGEYDICFHAPKILNIALPIGTRISMFPMAELTCTSRGLRWPTDNLVLSPWGRVATSNLVTEDVVALQPSGAGMLVILPRAHIKAAMQALAGG